MHSSNVHGTASLDAPPRNAWVHYVFALVAGALLIVPAFAGVMAVLDYFGAMPPPLLSNNLCLDEKLAFMRMNRPSHIDLLVVGSSTAVRHFNSPEAVRIDPGLRPYNAGLCGINLAQSALVIDWLTHRLPHVRRVLLIVSSLELGDCRRDPRTALNVGEADRFVFGNTSRLGFYLKSFNATTLVRNAIDLRRARKDMTWFYSVVLNRFGDAPVQPPHDRREWYQKAELDDHCFIILGRTARALDARGIQLAVVESPMDPRWREEFDRSRTVTPVTRRRIREAFGGTNAVLIENRARFSSADFYDAVHLRASSTARYTRSVLSQLEALDRGTLRSPHS